VRRRALAAAALALAGCGGGGGGTASGPPAADTGGRTGGGATPTAPSGAERRAPALTAAQLAGQHVIFPFAGRTPPPALVRRIGRGEAAGVIFLAGNLGTRAQVRALTRRLAAVPRPAGLRAPLLLMVDQEGGRVRRLPGAPSRSAPAMAATGDPRVARSEGLATAATLRAEGMNVDLAPVVDVVRPESALQTEGRGFGHTPRSAARFGAAFARGLREGGVAATAKHFPGFGAGSANTDEGQVTIAASARTLRAVDRPPFRAATARGAAQLVMLASAIYPALSPRPAVLSRRVVQGELRRGVGFAGVTISDDLAAPALAAFGGPAGAAVGATRAGVDLLLYAGAYEDADRAARALAEAVRAGSVDRAAMERSLGRVLALRRSL
jgi:beta-N-acetylhexosaminidase